MHFIVATLMVLTNLAEAVSFRGVRNATCHFDFVCIVANISSNRLNFTDATGHHAPFYCANGIPPDVASGYAFPSGNPLLRQSFSAEKIELVEHRDPAPYADTVKLSGTVAGVVDKDPEWCWLVLRTAEGLKGVVAKSKHYPFAKLQSLVDAEVEIEGIPYCTIGLYGAVVPHFSIRGKNSIRVLKNAPDSPFDAPPFSEINLPHRQVLSGTVIGTTSNRFALFCQQTSHLSSILERDKSRLGHTKPSKSAVSSRPLQTSSWTTPYIETSHFNAKKVRSRIHPLPTMQPRSKPG